MTSDASHEQLKLLAKEILLKRGFGENEIFQEIPVLASGLVLRKKDVGCPFDLVSKKGIVVDVAGVKEGFSIVVECGLTPLDRLVWLKLFFDEVLYLPFVSTIDKLDEPLRLQGQIEDLKREKLRMEETIKHQTNLIANMKARMKQILDSTEKLPFMNEL